MVKNKMEESVDNTQIIDLDDDAMELNMVEVPKEEPKKVLSKKSNKDRKEQSETITNCLRKERVIIRRVPRLNGIWGNNPKHVLSGGMSENAVRVFVVPKLSSGAFVNVLTDKEKAFLEEAMGLEYNALSIYRKVDNFWDDGNPNGVNQVRLAKRDNYLDLSIPEDYIKYKILLANKDFVAPSLQALQDTPKATYQFVVVAEEEENKIAKLNMNATMQCYKEFGKVEDDINTLRVIIETLDGRPTSKTVKLDFLKTKANDLIQADSKLFLKVITDSLLPTKVLIKRSIEEGLISNKGNFLYLRSDSTPLCEEFEEPTLNNAAKYLNSVKHQDILFTLQAKLNQ